MTHFYPHVLFICIMYSLVLQGTDMKFAANLLRE